MSNSAQVDPWLYWSLFPFHRALIHLYFGEITIKGQEHLPEKGPVILASKHFSRWDPLLLALLSTEPLRFMTRADQMTGIQGWIVKRLGGFSVNPDRPTISSLRSAIDLIHSGKKLVIFPEGKIVRDQPLQPLQLGLARLVMQAEATSERPLSVPVIPIALHYSPTASPKAKVFVHINQPLYAEQYRQVNDKQTARTFTEAIQSRILHSLELIAQSS